jgi:DNA-binding NtrC family response regulator
VARILIVEDELDMAENLREILEGEGARAEIAQSAEHALERLETDEFDGLISDFRLPGKNGVELLKEVRRRGSPVPVVLISGFMDFRASEEAEQAGALDILPKPLDLRRLLESVAEFSRTQPIVLVVDDNVDLAENIAEGLRTRGLRAEVAASASEALGRRDLPNAAILDIRLPDGSGLDVARRLAARDPSIQIVFLTGFVDEHQQHVGELARVFGPDLRVTCLGKPCRIEQLAEQLAGDE